ncbi:MAG: type I pullulanase [Lachnospiraceae bacterium]|nr:type I pullulanase [Lachnospiraceae bacterium]
MFVPLQKVSASEGVTLKLHYHRTDGNYKDWDVWLWEAGKDGAGYPFVEENGEMVATKVITSGATSIGFIVRTSSWDKDINQDQFIDIAEMASGTVHIYVESGVEGYTKVYGDDAVKGVKIKSARYNGKDAIEVLMTAQSEVDKDKAFTVKGPKGEVKISKVAEMGTTYQLILSEPLKDTSSYTVYYQDSPCSVTMPNIYSTEKFESEFTYTGSDLGATWTKEKTTFRVWSPVAEKMKVNLYKSGTEGTNDLIESIDMKADANGTWVAEKSGDQNGVYYTYTVTIDDVDTETIDPYARTAGVNGKRGMIIDLSSTNPSGWDADKNPNAGKKYTDAVIYETHIRDLTVGKDANISKPGTFLGVAELGTKTSGGIATGLSHVIELGATHLHILPMYDFGSVDETKGGYNWGYDPVNYNIPEGSYSTDPYNGAVRVGELKQMVKALHDNGISVVMDVVYNHVYSAGDFSVNKLVPGYFSRITESGSYSNGSGCGNDTATERSMVRKFVVDSVNYWADEYHIDGFRFDLVGLIDVDTINEIVETVHKKHPDVIFYGEGWSLTTNVTKENVALATQPNSQLTPGFAYFNDTFRDAVKGGVFNASETGFVSGASGKEFTISRSFLGRCSWCKTPVQSVNYAACHDNNTLFDRLTLSAKGASFEELASMNKLSAAITLTSEGIPFLMSGEEMLRTKKNADGSLNENSYNAGDSVNALDYSTLSDAAYKNVNDYYKGLIAFRKAHADLRQTDPAVVDQTVKRVDGTGDGVVAMQISGEEQIFVIFNANKETVETELPEGRWNICVNGEKAGTETIKTVSGKVKVAGISAMVLVQGNGSSQGSFPVIPVVAAGGVLVVGIAVFAILAARKKKK